MAIDDLREFRDVMYRMVTSFNGEMDSPKRKSYARMLDGIDVPIIEQALDRLIDENASGRKFFPMPTPADLKAVCAKVMTTKRLEAYEASLPDECQTCGREKSYKGARWKEVTVNGVDRMTQCDCRTVALQAADRVGQAIALPPSREDSLEFGS